MVTPPTSTMFPMLSFTKLLAPLHLLAYSTLLGTQLYQSFVMVKISYQALPRSAFTTLQKRVFPIYFRSQSLLLVMTIATFPPHGPSLLAKEKGDWIAFLVAGVAAGLNLVVYGPRTRNAMIERIHQGKFSNKSSNFKVSVRHINKATETRDGRQLVDVGAISDDMRKLNRSFSRNHAMSIHLNLITIGASLWYGWRLASRLKFETSG